MFKVALRIKLILDTNNGNVDLTFVWLYPFLKVLIEMGGEKPILSVFIFKLSVYHMAVIPKKKKKNKTSIVKSAQPTEINVTTSYGFKDPFVTGLACSTISIVQQFVKVKSFSQLPNFMAIDDYINVTATANVNVGCTLINFLKTKKL
jgi:hypothetical protein